MCDSVNIESKLSYFKLK